MAVTAKVDCRVCVISTVYETKQATLPRQNNQIHFGFGKNIYIYFSQNQKDLVVLSRQCCLFCLLKS